MSGTLQRIAASAIRPQPRVHPFVESIFAVPREEGFAAPILQQEIQPAGVPPPKTSPPDTQTSQPAAIGETVIERPSQLLDPRPAQRSARVPPLPPAAPATGNASLNRCELRRPRKLPAAVAAARAFGAGEGSVDSPATGDLGCRARGRTLGPGVAIERDPTSRIFAGVELCASGLRSWRRRRPDARSSRRGSTQRHRCEARPAVS